MNLDKPFVIEVDVPEDGKPSTSMSLCVWAISSDSAASKIRYQIPGVVVRKVIPVLGQNSSASGMVVVKGSRVAVTPVKKRRSIPDGEIRMNLGGV